MLPGWENIRIYLVSGFTEHCPYLDLRDEIILALDEALSRSQVVVITGGLGPTKDDITKHTLCNYFETTLKINDEALERITGFFKDRGLPMLEVNRLQAALPESCQVIDNLQRDSLRNVV